MLTATAMFQNRVHPLGDLITTAARGAWTGTRGVLHNEQQQIIRPYKLKAWLTCRLQFKGRKRTMMSPDKYTELFFMDEATAFAAGHRPCCECRREDFNTFKSLWLLGNPHYNFNSKTSVKKIDEVLHQERVHADKSKATFEEDITNIPNGTFVLIEDKAGLVMNNNFYEWSPFGYKDAVALPAKEKLIVITPRSVVNTFGAGYLPQTDAVKTV